MCVYVCVCMCVRTYDYYTIGGCVISGTPIINVNVLNNFHSVSSSTSFSRVVSVCPGEQLTLTCIANHSRDLTWNIILPDGNITESRAVPFTGSPQSSPFSVFGIRFNFKRLSTAQTLPLRSELLIDGINTNLSGTDIHCSPLNVSDPQTTFALHVLGGWWCTS